MDNKLYLMNGKQADVMNVKKYDTEAYLQEIIKDNPNLLARSMEDGTSKKLYLVKQEYSIKELEYGSISYSLDHLMVDEKGFPVLAEVKRSTDTRIKREVVAQMLDYASRASKWNIDDIRSSFRKNNESNKEAIILADDDLFWDTVSTNLTAEHFRLVFAADEIPDTLRILIEFLDRTMKDIEVYGVELKPYSTSDGTLLLASNIVGNSTLGSSKIASSARETATYTVEEFRTILHECGLDEYIPVFDEIYNFGREIKLKWESGKGAKHPSFNAKIGDKILFRIPIWKSQGKYKVLAEFWLDNISRMLNEKRNRDEIRKELIRFPDQNELKEKGYLGNLNSPNSSQYIYFPALKSSENLKIFLDAIKQLAEDIRRDDGNGLSPI